jgi:hypothetical protein
MAFSFIDGATNHGAASGSEMSTGTHGIALSSGRLVCVGINANDTDDVTPDQAGWTEAVDYDLTATSPTETARFKFWWRIAGGSEPSAYTFTASGASNRPYQCIIGVWSSATDAEVATAAVTGNSGGNVPDIDIDAADGFTTNDDELVIIFGGKDNDGTSDAAYTTVTDKDAGAQPDWSIVAGVTSVAGRDAAMAYRIYGTGEGETFSQALSIEDPGPGETENAYGMIIAFQESSGGGGGSSTIPQSQSRGVARGVMRGAR